MVLWMLRPLRYMGLAAAVLAWIVIAVSISVNPWFDLFEHALSDLGGPQASSPWIYNLGLIAVALVVLIYSIYLVYVSTNKMEVVGSAFLVIAAIFLALIGVFPAGTRPHTFVSTWFFIQMDLAIACWGIGLVLRGVIRVGYLFITLALVSPILALAIDWPSIAVQEIFGILIIDLYVVSLYLWVHR